jgi:hypothetical protein
MSSPKMLSRTPEPISPDLTFELTSPSYSPMPRNNGKGTDKFLQHQKLLQLQESISCSSNKIKLLSILETKVKKKIHKALYQAEALEKAKSRNELKSKEKNQFKEARMKEEEELREKNRMEKQRMNRKISETREKALKEKKESAKEIKKHRIEYDELCRNYRKMMQEHNAKGKYNIIAEATKQKSKLEEFASRSAIKLKKAYEDKISKEKEAYLQMLKHKEEVEKKAQEAAFSYTKLINDEIAALSALQHIAKVPLKSLGYRM